MTTILIVDNDISACQAVELELERVQPNWTVLGAHSGESALTILFDRMQANPVDVVLTEADLNDMPGFDLLSQARNIENSPVRITFTRDPNAEVVLGNTRANQRFLLKPMDAEHLATTIERSLRLRHELSDVQLKRYMSSITSVPSLPAIYDEMMQELSSPHSSLIKIGDIVESDAGLTLAILKVVNSAFYGINRRVESVSQAITLLGAHVIKNITLTTKVFTRYKGSTQTEARLTQLNNEAIQIGAMCNQFARYAKLPRGSVDHCQVAGMMANVGALVINSKDEERSKELGVDLIGASLLSSWYMSDTILEAVAQQHESPPKHVDIITPLLILHTIRYLQTHLTDANDKEQRDSCFDYISQYAPSNITELWLDTFLTIDQLSSPTQTHAA